MLVRVLHPYLDPLALDLAEQRSHRILEKPAMLAQPPRAMLLHPAFWQEKHSPPQAVHSHSSREVLFRRTRTKSSLELRKHHEQKIGADSVPDRVRSSGSMPFKQSELR